jgi:hypothetical protein
VKASRRAAVVDRRPGGGGGRVLDVRGSRCCGYIVVQHGTHTDKPGREVGRWAAAETWVCWGGLGYCNNHSSHQLQRRSTQYGLIWHYMVYRRCLKVTCVSLLLRVGCGAASCCPGAILLTGIRRYEALPEICCCMHGDATACCPAAAADAVGSTAGGRLRGRQLLL